MVDGWNPCYIKRERIGVLIILKKIVLNPVLKKHY
jgi:hypothetical protein